MARKKTMSDPAADKNRAIEQRVVAFAEQLGRLVGTVERKTTGWLDMAALSDQVTRIRDGAADLLSQLGGNGATPEEAGKGPQPHPIVTIPVAEARGDDADPDMPSNADAKPASLRPARSRAASPSGRSRAHVAAPGKAHRKPPPSVAGAQHSDETIAKAGATDRIRRTRGR